MSLETKGRRRAAKYIAKMQAKNKTCSVCGKKGLKVVKIQGGFGFFCKRCRQVDSEMDRDLQTDDELRERESLEVSKLKDEKKERKTRFGWLNPFS